MQGRSFVLQKYYKTIKTTNKTIGIKTTNKTIGISNIFVYMTKKHKIFNVHRKIFYG